MQPRKSFFLSVCLLPVFSVCSYGQAMVEHALGTARAGAAGGAMKGAGKAAGGVLGNAAKALDQAAGKPDGQANTSAKSVKAGPSTPTSTNSPAPVPAPASAAAAEPSPPALDPSQITVGLERRELVAKFGKPSMKMTAMNASQVVETYWYRAASRDTVVVILRDGKVASVNSEIN
ncbi:MAG: hypothetical protein HY236_05365 [Acidobacteria bacterium]|nr:hypothetical protein [Acidobacteriota bacterium]